MVRKCLIIYARKLAAVLLSLYHEISCNYVLYCFCFFAFLYKCNHFCILAASVCQWNYWEWKGRWCNSGTGMRMGIPATKWERMGIGRSFLADRCHICWLKFCVLHTSCRRRVLLSIDSPGGADAAAAAAAAAAVAVTAAAL